MHHDALNYRPVPEEPSHYLSADGAEWAARDAAYHRVGCRGCAASQQSSRYIQHIAGGGLNSSWWRHQMETFAALLALCAGNSPVTGEFPSQRPVTRNFDVFFDLRLNKRLSKQSRGWWFETSSCPLWRQCNGLALGDVTAILGVISEHKSPINYMSTYHRSVLFPAECQRKPLMISQHWFR